MLHAPITRRKVLFTLLGSLIFLSLLFVYHEFPRPNSSFVHSSTFFGEPFSDYLRLSSISIANASLAHPWTPLSLSTCDFGMPDYYAPCVAQNLSNVLYAEELIYPDFELREPYFAKEAHRERWRKSTADIRERAVLNSGWMIYKGQSGQNFVFSNVKYNQRFGFDSWSPESCMSSLVSASTTIQPLPSRLSKHLSPSILPTVLIAISPDSYSFQHYLDRVTHIIAQGSHLALGSKTTPYVVTGRRGSKSVQQLWAQMGYDADHILYLKQGAEAERMVFSCRAVLIHPWLSLKSLESLGVQHDAQSSVRNKVVYMSRSDGRPSNPGRQVVNEAALLRNITTFLAERGRGEELVVFDQDKFENPTQLFSWFSENVAAVVGPHGGAMINHRWAAKGTLVVEMMPTTRIAMMIFEEASVLSQTYAAIIVEPTLPAGTDMEVDPEDVIALLREHLGEMGEDPLRKSYYWRAKELGFR